MVIDPRTMYEAMREIKNRLQKEIEEEALVDAKHPEHLRSGADDQKIRYAAAASLMMDYFSSETCKAVDAGEFPETPFAVGREKDGWG